MSPLDSSSDGYHNRFGHADRDASRLHHQHVNAPLVVVMILGA
jgi:hypothetical protein